MLPRENRLKKKPEINQVFLRGSFLSCGFLSLKYLLTDKTTPRLAFSVGISYSPRAVERNRAKRLLRETTRINSTLLPPGLDGVFFINKKKLPPTIAAAEESLPRLTLLILKDLAQKHLK